MDRIERNQRALECLDAQNFFGAQKLLFENAQRHSSHETHNNLGYFLITEGFLCQNGAYRTALHLGVKHLLKAGEYRESAENYTALATAAHYAHVGTFKNPFGACTYRNAYAAMERAVTLSYSNEREYNRLRFLCLCDAGEVAVLEGLSRLVRRFPTSECVNFYLSTLCLRGMRERCLSEMKSFLSLLDIADVFTYYALCQEYEQALMHYDEISCRFALGEVGSALMIESLIHQNRYKEAHDYAERITAREEEAAKVYPGCNAWCARVFSELRQSTPYRRRLISAFRPEPPFVDVCCYFGCSKHKTTCFL